MNIAILFMMLAGPLVAAITAATAKKTNARWRERRVAVPAARDS